MNSACEHWMLIHTPNRLVLATTGGQTNCTPQYYTGMQAGRLQIHHYSTCHTTTRSYLNQQSIWREIKKSMAAVINHVDNAKSILVQTCNT